MKTKNTASKLQVEQLETRLVPSATANLANGKLTIVANNANDYLCIYQSNGVVAVAGNSRGWKASAVREIEVHGGGGNDTIDLRGVAKPAKIFGDSGHDVLIGGQNNDYIDGGAGEDRLFGMGGNDTLVGGANDDRLFGGDGYDRLFGGYGSDFMWDGSTTRHEFYANENDGSPDYIADMFAPASGYSPDHIKQGSQNLMCSFLSTLASATRAGYGFNDRIRFAGNDNSGVAYYDVKLFDGRAWRVVRVAFEGHVNAADAQRTADFASWSIIMQRAWFRLFGNRGVLPHQAMIALGLRPSTTATMNDQTFNAMQSALANKRLVVAGTPRYTVPQLENNHAYTVTWVGNYRGIRCVQVRNPWAYDGGRAKDSQPNDGYILLSWTQFARGMSYVAIG